MKGASVSLASRLAISVFPHPVGPIMRMFLGTMSSFICPLSCRRRQRLRSATATAFFAEAWPTMCLSSSSTTARGVSCLPVEEEATSDAEGGEGEGEERPAPESEEEEDAAELIQRRPARRGEGPGQAEGDPGPAARGPSRKAKALLEAGLILTREYPD